jgi:signal transduction histidine kinase
LGDDFPEGHPKRELLDTLVREADRLNNVLRRFLSFAKPLPVSKREFRPLEPVEEVVALLAGRKGTRDTEIVVHPPGADLPTLRGDPEQIRQVFLNILLNALQACGGEGRIDVLARHDESAGRMVVTIEDSGPGFPPEALENLFTPFFTTREGGSGLGLAISHRIVESHGGRITAQNRTGGGARVTIELPV